MFYLHTLQINPDTTNNIDKKVKTQISNVLGRDWALKYAIGVGYMYYVHKQMTVFVSDLINVNNISTGEVYQIIAIPKRYTTDTVSKGSTNALYVLGYRMGN